MAGRRTTHLEDKMDQQHTGTQDGRPPATRTQDHRDCCKSNQAEETEAWSSGFALDRPSGRESRRNKTTQPQSDRIRGEVQEQPSCQEHSADQTENATGRQSLVLSHEQALEAYGAEQRTTDRHQQPELDWETQ